MDYEDYELFPTRKRHLKLVKLSSVYKSESEKLLKAKSDFDLFKKKLKGRNNTENSFQNNDNNDSKMSKELIGKILTLPDSITKFLEENERKYKKMKTFLLRSKSYKLDEKLSKKNFIPYFCQWKVKNRNKISYSVNNKKNTDFDLSIKKPLEKVIESATKEMNTKYIKINTFPFNFKNLKYFEDKAVKKKIKKLNIKINNQTPEQINSFREILNKVPIKMIFPSKKKRKKYNDKNINTEISSFDHKLSLKKNAFQDNIKINILYLNKNNLSKKEIQNPQKMRPFSSSKIYYSRNCNRNKIAKNHILKLSRIKYSKSNLDASFEKIKTLKKNKSQTNTKSEIPSINKKFLERQEKQKCKNIFFDEFEKSKKNKESENLSKITEKNMKELKSHLYLINLKSKQNQKMNELNEIIDKIYLEILTSKNNLEYNSNDLSKHLEEFNNLTSQLTNDIIMHNCTQQFSTIQLRNKYNKVSEINSKIQNNINNSTIKQQRSVDSQNKLKDKAILLQNEIKNLQSEIDYNTNSGITYYKNILKRGDENRNVGLSWVVKRLLRLDYKPEIKDFPDYIDDEMYNYLIEVAKNKNIILDSLKELNEIKKDLLTQKNKKMSKLDLVAQTNNIIKEENDENNHKKEKKIMTEIPLKKSIIKDNIKKAGKTEERLYTQLEKLLNNFNFWNPTADTKLRIDCFCTDFKVRDLRDNYSYSNNYMIQQKKYEMTKIKDLKKNDMLLQLKKLGNDELKEKNYLKNKKLVIYKFIKKVLELRKNIRMSQILLNGLRKNMIKYIKNKKFNEVSNIKVTKIGNDNEKNKDISKKGVNNKIEDQKLKIIKNLFGEGDDIITEYEKIIF